MSNKINYVERSPLPHVPPTSQEVPKKVGLRNKLQAIRRLIGGVSFMQLNSSGEKNIRQSNVMSSPLFQMGCSAVDASPLRLSTETLLDSQDFWTPFLIGRYSTRLDQMYHHGHHCFTTFIHNPGNSYQTDDNKRVMYKYDKILLSEKSSTALLIISPEIEKGQSDPGTLPSICRYIDQHSDEYKGLHIQKNTGQCPVETGDVDDFLKKFLGERSISLRLISLDNFKEQCEFLSRKEDPLSEEEWKTCLETGQNYCQFRVDPSSLRTSKLFEEARKMRKAQPSQLFKDPVDELVKVMQRQLDLPLGERDFDFSLLLEKLTSDREVIVREDGEQPSVSHPLIIAANGDLAINAQRDVINHIFNKGRIPNGKIVLFTYNAASDMSVAQGDNVLFNIYHNDQLKQKNLLDRSKALGTLFSICHKTDSNQKEKGSGFSFLGQRLLTIKEDIREKKEYGEQTNADERLLELLDHTPIESDFIISDVNAEKKNGIKRRFSRLSREGSFSVSLRDSGRKFFRPNDFLGKR